MSLVHRPIWMHVAPNGQAKSPPVEPVWVGEPVVLDQVVRALRGVRETQDGPDIVSSGRVRSTSTSWPAM